MSNDLRRRDAGEDGVHSASFHCARCNDTRKIEDLEKCWACDGSGKYGDDVICGACNATGSVARQIKCPDCPEIERTQKSSR